MVVKKDEPASMWIFDKKTLSIKSNSSSSGVEIRYIKSKKAIAVSGWFDHNVGIEEIEIPLEEFIRLLGIKIKNS